MAYCTSSDRKGCPIRRLAEKTVLRASTMRRCCASWPTRMPPFGRNDTTLGWSLRPCASGITATWPWITVATTEFVVPRSIPMTGTGAGASTKRRSSPGRDAGGHLVHGTSALAVDHQSAHAAAAGHAGSGGRFVLGMGFRDISRQRGSLFDIGDDREITRAQVRSEAQTAGSLEHDFTEAASKLLRR